MNPIDELFHRLRAAKKKAFIPFIPAGDPDLATTGRLMYALDAAGAHLIEVGFPFSDPIADGPVIQAAYTRALDRGLSVEQVFTCVESVRAEVKTPLIGMASYTLIHRRGAAEFLDRAKRAGLAGAIVPDLPAEEAGPLAQLAADRDFRLMMLIAPTTTAERAERIVKISSGFVYCVSVAGITGERDRMPPELLSQLRRLRTMTDLPLCVGFGVSRPEHVQMLRTEADGVIVGSAIVRRVEQAGGDWNAIDASVRELAASLLAALNPADR